MIFGLQAFVPALVTPLNSLCIVISGRMALAVDCGAQQTERAPGIVMTQMGTATLLKGYLPICLLRGAATTSKPEGSLVDSTANWTQNWATFRVRHLRLQKGSMITDNDAQTIHYLPYGSTDRGPLTIFQTGDQYQIHHLLTQLDQNGRGKGDLVRVVNGQPINTVTNTPFWTH